MQEMNPVTDGLTGRQQATSITNVMQVRVRLFAALRERAGSTEIDLDLPEGAVVGDALERLHALTDGIRVVMAVNQEYADTDMELHAGDEVALIPPVSGGSVGAMHTRVTGEPLRLDELIERVKDPRAGAVVTFSGVTREVDELDYEAYAEMAEHKIATIVTAAITRHGLCAAAAEHRVGIVPLSEPSVIVAASAPHRDAAFAGAREIIDEIKSQAPIWKKEEGEWKDGTRPPTGPLRTPRPQS
jgi:MoaE-MoaD fusion protein